MSAFIDLSLPLLNDTPVFPGDPPIQIRHKFSVAKDGFSLHEYNFSGHVSTHIDGPAHFVNDGKLLSEIPLENFSGEAILVPAENSNLIDIDILTDIKVSKKQIIFFYSGYVNKLQNKDYFINHPILSEALVEKLVKLQVKIIGIDFPSPDREPYNVHKILLSKGIMIIENLCNLDKLPGKFKVYAFPLKVKTDGVPVRVVAEI